MAGQQGVDAHSIPDEATAQQLKTDGFSFIAQYIDSNDTNETPGSPGYAQSADGPANGSLTAAQAQQIGAGGLKILSIFETNGEASDPYSGGGSNSSAQVVNYLAPLQPDGTRSTAQGVADGMQALASARALGQPANSAVYFALDFDPGPGNYTPGAQQAVETYLTGVAQAFGDFSYKIGVYGAGQTLQWATTADAATGYAPAVSYTWLSGSTGWAGYSIDQSDPTHGWSLIQSIPGESSTQPGTAPGTNLPVDYDTSAGDDFGTWSPLCFCTGTRIRTARGEVAVERLAVGDLATTATGDHRRIRWIGRRALRPGDQAVPSEHWPVRIRAGAFGGGLPARDLRLSPGHPVLVGADADNAGGHLVPVMCLINGTTVEREPVEAVSYWHVELDGGHDVLLAEGLPAESFLDLGSRCWFGPDPHPLADPDAVRSDGPGGRCRPVAVDGPVVAAERRRLDAVFATSLEAMCAWPGGEAALPPG